MRGLLVSLLLISLLSTAPARDGDTEKAAQWHQWRGPHADGSAPNARPPLTWDGESGQHLRWKAPLKGKGSATPIVWGDRLFVAAAERTDRQATADELPPRDPRFQQKTEAPRYFYRFVLLCFDRASGRELWRQVAAERVPHEGHHQTHSYAGGSPTTDGIHVYVAFGSAGVYCYDFNGQLRWSRDLGLIHSRLGWGEAVSPVLHRGRLLLNWDQEADSALYCLDAETGKTIWRAAREERSTWTTPLVTEHQGTTHVILNGATRIRSHDFETGQVLWSCGGMTNNPIPSAVRVGETVVCMSGYRGAAAVAIPLSARGDLGTDGQVKWRYGKGTPYVPSPALAGNRLYFTDRNDALLSILDAETGKPILERTRIPNASGFYASPIVAAGRVYLVDRTGTTIVLKQGDTLEVLATNKLNDPIDASPVAVGRQLFLRGEKYLYCLEER